MAKMRLILIANLRQAAKRVNEEKVRYSMN